MKKCKGIVILIVIFGNIYYSYGLTEAQMASTVKLMRNMCQPKNKVTDEQIANFHKGSFDNDKKMMCYYHCVLNMMKLLTKDNKVDMTEAAKQLPTIPKKYEASTKKALEECNTKGGQADKCEAGYDIVKCIYLSDPEKFYLP